MDFSLFNLGILDIYDNQEKTFNDFSAISGLLDLVSNLKSVWATADSYVQKGSVALTQFHKK